MTTLLKLAFQLDGYAVDAGGYKDAAFILDLGLPDGLALCRWLRSAG